MAEERQGATLQLITPRARTGERVRINITIDKGLLRQADEVAEARGVTRSGLIEAALTATIPA
ncbi:ribbon-helix-helix protein, CopG family [Methylobacterium aquaticum]|uniref:ribbon-helix-helix protein, CopG family n=1 Tax=Methylobacterium aquaticum TaxID=270351 RepID=UPI003D7C266A